MPKYEKGILGVRKDPKQQMLFSFKVRQGSEWPSDDSDSDYQPSGDEMELIESIAVPKPAKAKRRIHQKREEDDKCRKKRKKINVIESDSEDSDNASPDSECKDTAGATESPNVNHKATNSCVGLKPKLANFDMFDEGVAKAAKYSKELKTIGSKDLWGQHIPPEILFKIFQFVIAVDGAIPFLCRAGKVCVLWNQTSVDPGLWLKVDLSYGWIKSVDATLQWLCKHRLSRVTDISLNSWKLLTSQGLQAIAAHCPHLETISLSYCRKVQSPGVKCVIDSCPQLRNIDLSFMPDDAVSHQSLKHVINTHGANLETLNLSGNKLVNFNALLNNIAGTCSRLRVLDVCNAVFSTDFISLNIERLQHGCPHLTALRLTNSKFRATHASGKVQAESPGFPRLQELSLAVSTAVNVGAGLGLNNEFLHRVLKTSHDLKLLDLRGCTQLTCRGLQMLSVTDLAHLYLSQSSISKNEGLDMVLHKWKHSLCELDLSWNTFQSDVLDAGIERLTDDPDRSQLQQLNLSGTPVTTSHVRSVLQGCPHLMELNLGSCRGLPRGIKREYVGQSLEKLRRSLSEEGSDDSSTDEDW